MVIVKDGDALFLDGLSLRSRHAFEVSVAG